ncbi:MAG: response regulator [Candidatus Portnoybacteria bacterium CG03_land_8_20_14_0_80_41_10]|uniref:Response regulator n=1 Tax=Candidatus Portnoybacteria bacterium CG03_land_8_20_14_0_80_41_10 TaxID=1974808 RepID=A0A2M7BV43_9BACT|nr:MAG: response regulator [Candidatus Portnoybacteria bacterium CG03_land_8_20_14_0_80_41_10]
MKKILIIEDDPFLNEMYATKFSQSGFQVELAVDGQEGLKKIRTIKPNLILLDIVLPKMDGFEVLKEVKKDAQLNKIPIVLLTNLGQKKEVEKGLSLGADEYIIKAHFTPTAVVAKVKEILEESWPRTRPRN